MMDRETLLAIVNSVDDSKLVTMLGSIGVQVGDPSMLEAESDPDSVEDWNLREVAVGPSNKPEIFDRNMTIKMPEMKMTQEMEYMDEDYDAGLDQYEVGQGGY